MAAPLVVSFVMRAAFTLVDTAYAATIGDEAVAAVGLTVPFEFLMIAVWVGLSTGLTSCLSRAMGAGHGEKIAQYLRAATSFVLWVAPPFVLAAVGIWLAAPHLGLAPDVARSFQIYGSVLVGGSALTLFWSVIPDSVVKAHHDTRSTMWAGIWSNLINVILNTLFTFVFHWGVFGIAFSTVVGRLGGLAYALSRARRHEERRRAENSGSDPTKDPAPRRSILVLALPSALAFGLMATESAVVNVLLATLDRPTEAIAAYSIYYRVTMFALNPILAVSVAMLPFAARRIGAGDAPGLRRGLRESFAASAAYSVAIVAPLLLLAAPRIAAALAEAGPTLDYTVFALRLVPLGCLAAAPFFLCRPIFEAMGRGRPGLFLAVVRYVVLTPPAVWLGLRGAHAAGRPGIDGVVVGIVAATAASSALSVAWLRIALRESIRRPWGGASGAGSDPA